MKLESKIKGKNPKEEEKKGELPLNTQKMLQAQASLTRVDFANALYYFHPRESNLFMVHYNPDLTDNYFCSQYQFLSDSKSKNRDGLAVINLYERTSELSKNIHFKKVCSSTNQCFMHQKSENDIKTLVMGV
jgi:hypothetical protein